MSSSKPERTSETSWNYLHCPMPRSWRVVCCLLESSFTLVQVILCPAYAFTRENFFFFLWAFLFISMGDFCQGTHILASFPEVNPFCKKVRKTNKKRLIIEFKKLERNYYINSNEKRKENKGKELIKTK